MTTSVEKETGMLEVGTHCRFCRQLDFLPFHCSHCEGDFCASHRSKEAHHCSWLLNNEQQKKDEPKEAKDNGGKYFQSLLPERGYIRVKNNPNEIKVPKSNVVSTSIRSTSSKSALDKLTSFFKGLDSKKKKTSKKTKSKTSNKMIQLLNIKRTAKGDANIPVDNRIYLYCCTIDGNEDTNELKEHELYINKVWPIGRALDYIAKQLNVPNFNNDFKSLSTQKLNLYKRDEQTGKITNLTFSSRVATEINDLDTLYLVRGEPDVASICKI